MNSELILFKGIGIHDLDFACSFGGKKKSVQTYSYQLVVVFMVMTPMGSFIRKKITN